MLRNSIFKPTIRNYAFTQPGAGLDINNTYNDPRRWRLLQLRIDLTTDATAIARKILVQCASSAGLFIFPAAADHTASLTYSHIWILNWTGGTRLTNGFVFHPLPQDIIMHHNKIFQTAIENIQLADQIQPQSGFIVEEILQE